MAQLPNPSSNNDETKASLLQLEMVKQSEKGAKAYIAVLLNKLQLETSEYLGNISCWFCMKSAAEAELFWMCDECDTTNDAFGYYCDDCKIMTERRHKKMGHSLVAKKLDKAMVYSIIGYKTFHESYLKICAPLVQGMEWAAENRGVVVDALYNAGVVCAKSAVHAHLIWTPLIGIAPVTLLGIDTVCNSLQYYRGEISGKEWAVEMGRSVSKNGAMFAGAVAGAKVGAVIGVFGGPIGCAIGAFVGAVAGGAVAHIAADALYKKCFGEAPDIQERRKKIASEKAQADTDAEALKRQEFLKEALKYFHYDMDDVVRDSNIFTEREISKKFRAYAKEHHPDRFEIDTPDWHNAHKKFCILNNHFGVLLSAYALLHNEQALEKAKIQKILAIQL